MKRYLQIISLFAILIASPILGFTQILPGSILADSDDEQTLASWLGDDQKGTLLYRRSTHGASAAEFHNRCNNQGPTLVIIKAINGTVFGGYTPNPWTSVNYYKHSTDAFLFNLSTNQRAFPAYPQYSIYDNYYYGPTFGGGHDIYINTTMNGGYFRPHSYYAVDGTGLRTSTQTKALTGINTSSTYRYDFGPGFITEIEVYKIEYDDSITIIQGQDITIELDQNGQVTITPQDIDTGTTDPDGTVTLSIDINTFTCDNLGGNSIAFNPKYIGSQTQNTQSHGGGYNPNTKEFWYPQWAVQTIYKYDENHNYLGTFYSGQNQMMQLWMDTDSDDYYTANWANNTITRRSGSSMVWSYNFGYYASAVTTDANYVYALKENANQITVLNKETGAYVKNIPLPGNTISRGGVAYANGYFYIAGYARYWSTIPNNWRALHKIDASTGEYISSTSLVVHPYNMAFDGETMWISDNSSTIYGYQIAKGNAYEASGGNSVTLTATDPLGNTRSQVFNVTVQDNLEPTLTLNGAATVEHIVSTPYVDAGATVTDNCSATVETANPVDENTIGTYTVTYTATDEGGNTATATRTVNVIASDQDGDGVTITDGDCDDTNAEIYPGATEIWYDGVDQNCDDLNDFDADGDGFVSTDYPQAVGGSATGTGDCDDNDASINPDADEITCNGIDENCNGMDDDDPTPPTVVTQDITVQLDKNGQASITADQIDNGSTDNCEIASLTIDKTDLDCSNIGSNTVTLTVTDTNGNSSTETAIITVDDDVIPVVLTQNITVELDENGQASITADQIDNGSTDNCEIASLAIDKTDFDCSNVGSSTVTLTVTDVNGNISSAEATVTVEDNTPPSTPSGSFTAEYYDGPYLNTYKYSDEVDAIHFNWVYSSPNPAVLGNDYFSIRYTNTITAPVSGNYTFKTYSDDGVRLWVNNQLVVNNWTAHPPTWNSGSIYLTAGQPIPIKLEWFEYGGGALISLYWESAEAGITSQLVTGNQSQSCLNITVNLDENGSASILPSDLDPGYTDACGIADRTLSKSTFDCNDIGINTVTLTITDNNGNSSICEPTVTVVDEIAPTVITQDITVQLDNSGAASILASDIDDGSNDACGIASIELDKTDFACSDIGENTVTLTVTDNNGNISTATAIITIEDNIAPSVITQNITVEFDESGQASITADQINNGSTDNCGIETLSLDITDFSCDNVGDNTVELTGTDINGNSSTATATVTVEDNIIPIAIAQDITIELDDNGQANITAEQIDNGSTDNCGISSLNIQNGVSDYIINGGFDLNADGWTPIGNQIPGWIEWKSTGGNPGGYYILNDVGGSSGFDPAIEQNITDLNIGDTYIIKGDYRNQYTGVIGQVAFGIDIDGNEIAALVSPGQTWSPFSIAFTATSSSHTLRFRGEINGTDIDMAIDNIVVLNTAIPAPILSFDCSNVGSNTVSLIVTDLNGNLNSISATVTVQDSIAPSAIAKNAIVFLDNSGNGSITAEEINNGSFDACGIESMSVSPDSFTCDDYGLNTVSLTVTDIHGNVSTADAEVNVLYNSSLGVFNQADYMNIGNSVYLGDGEYRLTPALNSQFGAVWYQNQIDLSNDFDMEFDIYLGNKNGADGMAFVLQPLNTAQGSRGGGLGYRGIKPSIAVEFDTYKNALDPHQDHVALMKNGEVIHGSIYTLAGPYAVSELENGQYHSLKISWDAQTFNFRVTLDNNLIVNYSGNIVSDIFSGNPGVYWGFTAATGGLNNEHRVKIYDLDFVEDFSLKEAIITASECSDSQDGSIDINLTYNPCYTYLWSNSETTEDISGLNAGQYTVTVYHPDGRTITETYTVTIGDDTPPEINVQNTLLQLNEDGEAILSLESVLIGVTDNCGVLSTELSQTNFSCSDIGDNSITIVSEDINGNISSATATVTVEDNIAPTAISQNITIQLDENGEAGITAEQIDDESTDNCGIESLSLDLTSFSCADIGVNAVELTVIDVNGNSSTSSATVTVQDNVEPEAIAKNITIQLNIDGTVSIEAADVDDGSDDACGIASLSVAPNTFSCENVGSNTVTLTVTDNNANVSTVEAIVTVEDNVAPEAIAQDITIQLDDSGAASITASDIDNGSNDACGIASLSVTPNSFTCSEAGPNTVILTVTDNNANVSTVEATVTVEDIIIPTVQTQAATIYLDDNGAASITVAMINNESFDNCGIETLTLDVMDFSCADVGENTITLTAVDVNGNTNSETAIVTVVDAVIPTVITQSATIYLDADGLASITVDIIDNESYDNCGIKSLTLDKLNFSCADVGENTVTLTATDVNGNTNSATAIVTVVDDIIPTVITQPATIYLDDNGAASITVDMIDNESYDNCGIESLTLNNMNFTCNDVGENAVTLTAVDVNGNTNSETAIVTVVDAIIPTVITQPATIYLDANGLASITVDMIDNESYDNCGIKSLTLDKLNFSCADVGENTVTLTATDVNGNTNSATAIVTVIDNIDPTVLTQDITVELDENGQVSITAEQIDDGSSDNCTVAILALDIYTFNCSNVGMNEVELTVTDSNGNSASAVATVTVQDNIYPTLTCVGVQEHCANNPADNSYTITGVAFDLIEMWDNCSIESVTNSFNNTNSLDGANFPVGRTMVTWTVIDASGNINDCSFEVIINPLPIASITPSGVSMCCNELTLTASSSTSENLYEWSNGETTQSIGLSIDDDLEGTYTVIVTDQNGCISPYAASYDYIPENLASSYIILGFESALIGQNHLVKNGAVGSSYSDGKAHFLRYAEVNGIGAFVKAPKIIAHKTSSLLVDVIKEQAIMELPQMQYNTSSKINKRIKISNGTTETLSDANTNLTIGDNCNITLTGQVFGNIILGSGSSLTFTNDLIDIRKLQMKRANKNTPSFLVFENDAVVRVKEKVMLDSYCIVNPDHLKVIFYIGEEYDGHHGQLHVKSEGAEFNACAYVPRGEIHVQENPKSVDNGYMNGQFFAEKIIGNGKNVIWNWTGSNAEINNSSSAKTLPVFESQTLTIYPSPNDGSFMLFVESEIDDNFSIRIFNQLGALVHKIDQFNIREGSTKRYISITDIVPGVYTVELLNNESRLIQKMVVTN